MHSALIVGIVDSEFNSPIDKVNVIKVTKF